MRIINRPMILGLAVAATAITSAWAMHAHKGPAAHAAPAGLDLLSISGSPDQLADRSTRLAAHICAVIEAGTDCRLTAIAERAASDLRAPQDSYSQAQQALHSALISPTFDATVWQAVEGEQLERLQAGSRRYLQFLAEASSTLSVEQKRRFAH